ncbi:PD-(D/E)XK nuclease family protein [Bacillus sp. FJAT-22090]|uniref:PDDEXK-like family protein n=1 Tax=Bacillus sp. FJAT-22090 TaxID=1581038 RepID=UPI001642AF4C|nr:PD-(D/E)XK nuclease family protein [Bacillus sp. FJAT-22090]
MKIELLLYEVSNITKKHEFVQQKTGGFFNIFEITNIAYDEVRICRFLYELLNPKGSHYQGDLYLKLFVEHVLQLELPLIEWKQVKVHREFLIEDNRRIDLVIQTPNYLVPIEVKIFARDQENQCADYLKVAQNANVYYLTRFGILPPDSSSVDKALITPISFSQDIIKWLDKCLEQRETMKVAPIREVLLQFIAAIKNFTDQLEDEQEMEIKNILTASPTSMKSAFAIEKSLKGAKSDLLQRVFKELEVRIGLEKLHNEYDYAFNDQKKVSTYYDFKSSTYPGNSYLYKEGIKPGVDIWFRIEIDWCLYAGFVVAMNGEAGQQVLSEKEIGEYIPHIEPCIDNWWAYWELLPHDDETLVPNFKRPNDEDLYFKLFDEVYFKEFIDKTMERIEVIFR